MITLLTYDIEDDRVRNRIAEACKDYGLSRIQYSVFMGSLRTNHREELETRLRIILGSTPGDIRLFPICDKDIRLAAEIVVKGIPKIKTKRQKLLASSDDDISAEAEGELHQRSASDRRRIGRWEVPKRDDDHLYPFDSD